MPTDGPVSSVMHPSSILPLCVLQQVLVTDPPTITVPAANVQDQTHNDLSSSTADCAVLESSITDTTKSSTTDTPNTTTPTLAATTERMHEKKPKKFKLGVADTAW
jgi:hypothetical protein